MGNAPTAAESGKNLALKLRKLTVILGKNLRTQPGLPGALDACLAHFLQQLLSLSPSPAEDPHKIPHGT